MADNDVGSSPAKTTAELHTQEAREIARNMHAFRDTCGGVVLEERP